MNTVGEASEYRTPSISYELGEKLGEGAFGEVFKATESGGKRRILAVKLIRCHQDEDLENAIREIAVLTRLNHKNIVKMYDFGARQEWQMEVDFSLLLEFCSKGGLDNKLARRNSTTQKLHWMRSITSAVVYLHSEGIVHQDLKPDNILLTENNVIKVADFGLARRFAQRVEGQTWKDYYIEQGVGAIAYVAPEMLGNRHDNKVDVFSMGIVFHAILEGMYRDYGKERLFGVFVEIESGQKEPIGMEMYEKKRDLLVPFQGRRRRIIERMLKYDPKQRPTARDVQNVLRSRLRTWFQLVY